MTNKLEQAINYIVEKEPYWSEVIIRMKRNITYSIPTIGVSYDVDGVILHVNPYFIQNMLIKQAASIIKHECEHIGNDHFDRESYVVPGFKRQKGEKKTIKETIEAMTEGQTLNIAEDIAINQHINDLPKIFFIYDEDGNVILDEREIIEENDKEINNDNYMLPLECKAWTVEHLVEVFKELKINKQVEKNKPFEYYYHLLKQHEQELEQFLPKTKVQVMVLDDHDFGDNLEGENVITDPEMKKEIAKNLLEEARQSAEHKSAGCTPSHIVLTIEKLSKIPKNWRKDLSKFIAKHTNSLKESSRTFRNRRQRSGDPLIPGFRPKTKVNMAALFDISGSMRDEELEQIVAELNKIHQMGTNITVIQFDSEIRSIEEFKTAKINIMGRGGTCFNPPLKKVVDKDFIKKYHDMDGIIFFTDGEPWEDSKDIFKPNIPLLWALNEGCKAPVDWGWKTEIIINAIKN